MQYSISKRSLLISTAILVFVLFAQTGFAKRFTPLEAEIQQIFAQKILNIAAADQATYKYIYNYKTTRIQKIQFIWSLANQYSDDNLRFCYLTDMLAMLKPVELVNELIKNYNKQKNKANKKHIILLMNASIRYKTKAETEAISKKQIQDIMKIQKFLKNVATTK